MRTPTKLTLLHPRRTDALWPINVEYDDDSAEIITSPQLPTKYTLAETLAKLCELRDQNLMVYKITVATPSTQSEAQTYISIPD